jgi:hypothetical protein
MYSMLVGKEEEPDNSKGLGMRVTTTEPDKKASHMKAKGVQTGFMKSGVVSHADYKRCLVGESRADKQQMAGWNTIRSFNHNLCTYSIRKVGLCAYDNKRFLLNDGITSLSYGHKKIPEILEAIDGELEPEWEFVEDE